MPVRRTVGYFSRIVKVMEMGQRSMDTMTSVAMIIFTAKVLGFEHHPSKMECLVVVQWLSHV